MEPEPASLPTCPPAPSETPQPAPSSPYPEQRAEDATKARIRELQLALGKRLAALAEHPNSRKTVTDWCREVTSYDGRDGPVRGVPDYRTVMSIDRLERSIEDADWWLAKLDGKQPAEAAHGSR